MAAGQGKSVLFVCLGNICRSPIAEAVFRKLVKEENIENKWIIDSGAVSDWNVGRCPDPRALNCLRNHEIETAHKARQITKDDFLTFDYILCMDESNLQILSFTSGQRLDRDLIGACLRYMFHSDRYTFWIIARGQLLPTGRDLRRKCNQIKNCKAKIELLGSYDPQNQLIIEDPYYGNDEDFETVYQQCLRCCKEFLEKPH